ncbi:hypothetical protein GKODMF_12220 [Candidatus Electrothrix gigas]
MKSPIEQWQVDFAKEPLSALDKFLQGQVYMGALQRNALSEILFRLFHAQTADMQTTLDRAMQEWFTGNWMTVPQSMPVSRWVETLSQAFFTVYRLRLSATSAWLADSYTKGRPWLRGLYLNPARAPEAALLRTLALCQSNQDLLPLWMRLCRMEEDLPRHYAAVGLLGLRKLPEQNGEPAGDLSPSVFQGLVALAEAIATQVGSHEKKATEQFWLREFRAIMELYPRSDQYWLNNFLPIIGNSTDSAAAKMLRKIPGFAQKMERQTQGKAYDTLRPPPAVELKRILRILKELPLQQVRTELDPFLEKHRQYARQTGDSEYLVKTFCNIGKRIFKQDISLALNIIKEAFLWEPYNYYVWSIRAKIEEYQGNVSQAIALLWEAKRKFPEEPVVRNALAKLLNNQGRHEIAELLYRQTIIDFPKDEVCRNGLAEVLKTQDKLPEAETVYRQTMKDFPEDVVCRTGLAEVLKTQDKLPEAEAVYRQTMKDFPENVFCRTGLAEVLKALGKSEKAEEICRQAMRDFPQNAHCRCVLAKVLLQAGEKKDALALLNETVQKFPTNSVAKKFLAKFQKDEDIPELAAGDPETAQQDIMPGDDSQQGIPKAEYQTSSDLEDRSDENQPDDTEPEIGLISLYRQASRQAAGEKQRLYREKVASAFERVADKAAYNIPAQLEKGWWLLEQSPEQAEAFFSKQIKIHPNILGFRLGNMRSQYAKGDSTDTEQWNALTGNFTSRSTLVRLEQAMQELTYGNGNRLHVLENLRRRLRKGVENLPASVRENEKWTKATLTHTLFKTVGTDIPLTKSDLAIITKNYQEHKTLLQSTSEQCLAVV